MGALVVLAGLSAVFTAGLLGVEGPSPERGPVELQGVPDRFVGVVGAPHAREGRRATRGAEGEMGREGGPEHRADGLVEVAVDPFSTFAADVDTGSYTMARRTILASQTPSPTGVRVEEFVNYFDYGYPDPDGEAPFVVNLEVAPSPWHDDRHVMRVGVQARAVEVERAPIHLTFLVDVSGSMSAGDKLPLAQQALHRLVERLQPDDTVALATYAGHTGIVLEPTEARHAAVIHDGIADLRSGGGTGMASGMQAAYRMAASQDAAERRVVVLSDGDANIGPTSHEAILASVAEYAAQGVTLSTVGFGTGNYQDSRMEQLANQGDGNYFYVDSIAEVDKVFGQDLTGTLVTIARDVKIQVEFHPEVVEAYRLVGYDNREIADRDFRVDAVDAGEIGAGHSVTALYEVVLRDDPVGDLVATARVRHKPPHDKHAAASEVSTAMPVRAVHPSIDSASYGFRLAVSVATFAELLRGSPSVEGVDYAAVAKLADGARRGDDPEAKELVKLIRTAGELHWGARGGGSGAEEVLVAR